MPKHSHRIPLVVSFENHRINLCRLDLMRQAITPHPISRHPQDDVGIFARDFRAHEAATAAAQRPRVNEPRLIQRRLT
jgi:hypothetical protein